MKAEVRLVTPEMAKAYLMHNDSNRSLRRTRVLQYAHDMKEGKWNLTGQGITFGKDGNLLDGQHRLNAVVLADVPVEFLVITDAETVSTYDCGLTRSIVDRFKLTGRTGSIYTTVGQAIIRLCYLIQKYGVVTTNVSPTTSDIEQYIDDNLEDMIWAASLMESRHNTLRGLRRSIISATLYSMYKLNVGLSKDDVEHICDVLKTGVSVYEYDTPVIALRNKLITTTSSAGNGVNKELFLRLQYMCKQYIGRNKTLRTVYPKENLYDFTKLNNK